MARWNAKDTEKNKKLLLEKFDQCLVLGLDLQKTPLSEALQEWPGIVDWFFHGQLSQLALRGELKSDAPIFLHTGLSKEKKQAMLFPYLQNSAKNSKNIVNKLSLAGANSVTLIPETFPQDFYKNLRDHLDKEGIRWSELGSEHPQV